ncbi:MAG: hypothetical protein J07HX5_00872, partial [halophilic archaeon J07HX5]
MKWLYAEGVDAVYVDDLTDVLSTHWCAEVNAKTHQFWTVRAFIDRLSYTAEEYGITVGVGQNPIHPEDVRRVASKTTSTETATCSGVRVVTKLTPTCARLERCLNSRLANPKSGRWLGPRVSTGTTTVGRRYHTFPREQVLTRSAQTEYRRREACLHEWIANIPTGGIPRLQPWENVNIVSALSAVVRVVWRRCGRVLTIVFRVFRRVAAALACASPSVTVSGWLCRDELASPCRH